MILSLALGKTLTEIEQMPESHLCEYEAFYRKQPFGLWREDYRMAQVAHLLAMINRDPKFPPPQLTDFMPMWQKKPTEAEEWDSVTQNVLAHR
ncbi:DUF4035 domain-containing protein [Proteus terrae]|uniref:phage tail assembly protein T n=2 Tax=Morganellaceae TaxID=1903414 RepID=UPI000D7013EA|nr:DUF4035 domain-containing protein [Proteus mirabilis]NBN45845.1 DUF4035 domain-containing protein [Proteus sp. G2626]